MELTIISLLVRPVESPSLATVAPLGFNSIASKILIPVFLYDLTQCRNIFSHGDFSVIFFDEFVKLDISSFPSIFPAKEDKT